MIGVNNGLGRDRLGEGNVYGSPLTKSQIELGVGLFRTFLPARTAARTGIMVYLSRFLQEADLKVAHKTLDLFHFRVGHKSDIRMLGYIDHLGSENA